MARVAAVEGGWEVSPVSTCLIKRDGSQYRLPPEDRGPLYDAVSTLQSPGLIGENARMFVLGQALQLALLTEAD